MKRVGDHLDPSDAYRSEWLGGKGSGEHQLGGDGKPVVGVFGKAGDWVDGVGIIQAE